MSAFSVGSNDVAMTPRCQMCLRKAFGEDGPWCTLRCVNRIVDLVEFAASRESIKRVGAPVIRVRPGHTFSAKEWVPFRHMELASSRAVFTIKKEDCRFLIGRGGKTDQFFHIESFDTSSKWSKANFGRGFGHYAKKVRVHFIGEGMGVDEAVIAVPYEIDPNNTDKE